MPFMNYEFPNSNYYDTDLRELVHLYKEIKGIYESLEKEIQDTIDFVNNFEQHADELIDERIKVALSLYLQRLMRLEEKVKELEEKLNQDDGVLGMIEILKTTVADLQRQINDTNHLLAAEIQTVRELLHQYKYEIDSYVDSKVSLLEQYIKDTVTKVDRLDVISPITGLFEPIQKVLDEMYNILVRSFALTAQQYDSLRLTAKQYDLYGITAYEYDTHSYFELYFKLTTNLMLSPFSGKMEKIEDVVNDLTNLHKCALTAQEYDDRQISAGDYDGMEITAFVYDWWGFIVVRKITAGLYDALRLEAQVYDNKLITAKEYDRWAGSLYDLTLSGCNTTSCGDYQLLAQQIADMTSRVNAVASARKGTTYVLEVEQGETEAFFQTPNVYEDTLVRIESTVKPSMIMVLPHEGVKTKWPESATRYGNLSYNVSLDQPESGWNPKLTDKDYDEFKEEISQIKDQISVIRGVKSGSTFVSQKEPGLLDAYVETDIVDDESFVDIMSDKQPLKIAVIPKEGVHILWGENVRNDTVAFNVTVHNKN